MSELLNEVAEASDAELIVAVRAGDTQAYGALFGRHRDAATRMARQLTSESDADDLVAEGFIRVLAALQNGNGPDEFFRAYLLTSIRRLHISRIRASQRVRTTDDDAQLDRAIEFVDPAEMQFEQGAAATAFASLPERWQLVLWHLDVEGQKPADIAPLLGMSPNGVSALAYRAREGLRQAYLQSHLAPALHASCRTTTGLLGAYVRKGLSNRDAVKVEAHLEDCSRCTGLYLELADINGNLAGILGPVLLGSVFTGYAAAGAGASAGAVGLKLIAAQGAKLVAEPVKSVGSAVVGSGAQGIVAAAVVTSVAAAGTIAVATDFNSAGKTMPAAVAATASAKPTAPAAAARGTAGTPSPRATPIALAPTPTLTPTQVEPSPGPTTPTPTSDPAPPTASTPTPTPTPTSAPTPTPTRTVEPPITPTDYGVTTPVITSDDTLLQRRFTIAITAANSGRAANQLVTVTMQFTQQVQFRGVVSPGWDCGTATRNQHLTSLSCSTTLLAGQGTTFIVKARGLRPAGTITVTANDDPRSDNNTMAFRSPVYQFPS